jgi:biopolymer transport protein TolQ
MLDWDLIFGESLVVTAVLIVLFVASVASWAVIVMKFRELAAAERATVEFMASYRTESIEASYNAARDHARSPLAVVFTAGFRELARIEPDTGSDPTGEQVEQVIRGLHWVQTAETHRLERGLAFLATIGSSAPFVGLFGTVIGIMNAFGNIGLMGSASLAVVAPGISEALIATAVGLFAAIPAVIAYNYTSARLAFLTERLEAFLTEYGDLLRRTAARAA